MAIAGMGTFTKLPEHSTWIGAVAGGLADGARTAKNMSKMLIRGGTDMCPDQNGKQEFVPLSRMETASAMKQMVKADMYRHTRSVADPAAFQRWNEAVDRFQAGHKFEPFIPGVSCMQPYGPTH